MEVVSDTLDKGLVNPVLGLRSLHLLIDLGQRLIHPIVVLLHVQIRYLTRVEYVVDILEERFVHYLSISHEECALRSITASIEHFDLDILPEVTRSVILGEFDLKTLAFEHKASQAGQTLLPASTHSYQHRISSRLS